jgi:cytochrome P450
MNDTAADLYRLGNLANPWDYLDGLAAGGPVHPGVHLLAELLALCDGPAAAGTRTPFGAPGMKYVTVTGWDACEQAVRDDRLSSAPYRYVLGPTIGEDVIIGQDGAEHIEARAKLGQVFGRRLAENTAAPVIAELAEALLAELVPLGRADLVGQVCRKFPIRVIARLLGLHDADVPVFEEHALAMITASSDPDAGQQAAKALTECLEPVVAAKRAAFHRGRPHEDVLSDLMVKGLDDEHVMTHARLLIPAGAETTHRATSNMLLMLLTHLRQWDRAQYLPGGPDWRRIFEEAMRVEPPVLMAMRLARKDTEIAGTAVPAGALVTICAAAANRDPKRWPSPGEFRIFRTYKPNATFGGRGKHYCLGAALAFAEAREVGRLVMQLPGIRLDPRADTDDRVPQGVLMRSSRRLDVRWDTA